MSSYSYEHAIWKISARDGFKQVVPYRIEDFSEDPVWEPEPPFYTLGYVRRSRFTDAFTGNWLNPWTNASARALELVSVVAQIRTDRNFDYESGVDWILIKCGSKGPAYKIEKMPSMQEVFRFD